MMHDGKKPGKEKPGTLAIFTFGLLPLLAGCAVFNKPEEEHQAVIVCPAGASAMEILGAKEVQRYVYLRTGRLLDITDALPGEGNAIVVAGADRNLPETPAAARSLPSEAYLLKTVEHKGRRILMILGGDGAGTLYGAYAFAEHLGVRFYLHGDVVPDGRIPFAIDDLDRRSAPLFALRGIQPFHDFPEGPDWWNLDDYKTVLAQLPKMGMNFFGLHTYPEGGVGPEPTVWIGTAGDLAPDGGGRVGFAYPSRHFTTHTGGWGYAVTDTADYAFGAAALFERDVYGADYMSGLAPVPETPEDQAQLFNRFGSFLREAFSFARDLGIRTCLGTETPLIIPAPVKERLAAAGKDPADPAVIREVYEGLFRRIMQTHPLDYYWFWTPEGWTWSGTSNAQVEATLTDLEAAIAAAEAVEAPFALATCGWVLGPPGDRALFDRVLPKEMALSCISRNVGFAPVEPGFHRIEGRPKWSIPWLEDDPALIVPQLWAGRMRRDAADSLAYGCTGLMGIHWRTRVLGPNVSALARAAWDQRGWNPDLGRPVEPPGPAEGPVGGNLAAFPDRAIADTEEDILYRTVRYDMDGYRLDVPNGTYRVTLKFCEPHYGEAGKRVFGAKIQGQEVIKGLDLFAEAGKDRALDYAFDGILVTDGALKIEFIREVEFPSIAAIAVEGRTADTDQAEGRPFSRRINCAGPAWEAYEADLGQSEYSAGLGDRTRDLPVEDFYADWASALFGPEAAKPLAALFTGLDGGDMDISTGTVKTNLPRPSTWVGGPGGIVPDPRPWEEVQSEYAFVDEMERLRPRIRGAGNLERFDYWMDRFRYLRAVGRVNCAWAKYHQAMERVMAEQDASSRKDLARDEALPLRVELVNRVAEVHRHLLRTVTTTGALGTVANWQQHILPSLLTKPGEALAEVLGSDLPPEALPSGGYEGPPRMIVPTKRTSIAAGEGLRLRVILLGMKPSFAALHWRSLGAERFKRVPVEHVARGVYAASLPPGTIRDTVEYYIEAEGDGGEILRFPPTAPDLNHTVVVMPGG